MCFSGMDHYHVRLACMARHFSTGFLCIRCEVMFIKKFGLNIICILNIGDLDRGMEVFLL